MKISTHLVPTIASTLFSRIALGVGVLAAGIGITSAVLPQAALAQQTVEPLGDFTAPSSSERSSLYGESESGLSVFDLIHSAQTGGPLDFGEFSTNKRQEIDSAADAFRREQLRRLQQPTSPMNLDPNSDTTSPQN